MADETKQSPLFGKPSTEPEVPGTSVADKVQGETSPGLVPSFGKRDGIDENVNLQNKQEAESIAEGSAASSGSPNVDMAVLEAQSLAGAEPEDGGVQYASPGIQRLAIGPYEFENGVLTVRGDDVEKFEHLLSHSSPSIQQEVMKIDREAGEAVAARFLNKNGGTMLRGGDHTGLGTQAPNPQDPDNQPPAA